MLMPSPRASPTLMPQCRVATGYEFWCWGEIRSCLFAASDAVFAHYANDAAITIDLSMVAISFSY